MSDNITLILKKLDRIELRLDNLERLDKIEFKLDNLQKVNNKMSIHIDFINNIYEKIKLPFHSLINSVRNYNNIKDLTTPPEGWHLKGGTKQITGFK